ncbi:MAG: ethanolamine utilization microcompartment protein EutL [Oscillospiraceae bacterium]|nr:ethanolamine utilization microcompartment protein EutL [Oscillospiraceae bacterium]
MIPVQVLSARVIANVAPALAAALKLQPEQRSIALLTTDCDDATYIALDEATKAAAVEVVYGRSFYGGAANASTRLAGEVIGILAGADPTQVRSGLRAALNALEHLGFEPANEAGDIVYLAHTVSASGRYLSRQAGVQPGTALAYLIAPPLEALEALDAALKTAAVELGIFYPPPSETNFAGALLTGSQSACEAACRAFAQRVRQVAQRPKDAG